MFVSLGHRTDPYLTISPAASSTPRSILSPVCQPGNDPEPAIPCLRSPGPMKASPDCHLSPAAWLLLFPRKRLGVTEGNHPPLTSPPLGPVAGASAAWPAPVAHHGSRQPTHSSRMSTTSVRFSKTSCSVMMLGCSTCRRMLTSRSMSSRHTPRRLARLCRFLMNLAAYSSPVLFSRHFFTMANWPLWGHRLTQLGCH